MLNTYDNFTLNSIFRPLSRKTHALQYQLHSLCSTILYLFLFMCVTSRKHERNATRRTAFPVKVAKNTCFMLTHTRHEIHNAHKYPNTNNYLYSHTYLHDNTALGARNRIPSSFKHI